MTSSDPSLESNFRVVAAVGGISLGECDSCSGGDPSSALQKTRIGTSPQMQVTLPNVRDNDDIVINKKGSYAAGGAGSDWETCRWLMTQIGATVTVSKTPLDAYGLPSGDPLSYTGGRLQKVTPPSYDNESTTVAMIVLNVTGGQWQ
jgi:hypothetical protein